MIWFSNMLTNKRILGEFVFGPLYSDVCNLISIQIQQFCKDYMGYIVGDVQI